MESRTKTPTSASPLRRIFAKIFPRKAISIPKEAAVVSQDQKKELALRYLAQGEMSLLQGNLSALSFFEAASNLDSENVDIWYRQGLAFFEYGSEEGKEKALLIACKNFKIATQLQSNYFEAWVAWGNALLQLGRFHEEHHFVIDAKEKYQKALEISAGKPVDTLAELYWDYGIVWMEIAGHSGEAHDLKLALEALERSASLQKAPSPEFLNDCGTAYLELGLLVNDSRLYIRSIEHLQKAVAASPLYFDGWMSLAESYSQAYINTLDERFSSLASDAYAQAAKISPRDPEVWLSWGQTLGESGRLCKDAKLLRQAIEKCARAYQLDKEDSQIVSQWIESLSYLSLVSGRLDLLLEAENKAIKATEQTPDDPNLWYAYGICMIAFARYYEDGEYYEMAIEKLQYGLSIDRTDPELWHALGQAHKFYAEFAEDRDLIERSVRFLSKAMDLKPSCPALLFDMAAALLHFSQIFDDQPSVEQSIVFFEMLLQNYPAAILHNPDWLMRYASALDALGHFSAEEKHYARAIEIYSHVLLIDPDFASIHHRMALSYVQLGHLCGASEFYRKAVHFFRLAIREDEENDQIWLDWGSCLIDLAHHTLDTDLMNQLYLDAEEKILRAGQLGNTESYYTLAALYSILGRLLESMDLITKALYARALPSLDELLEDEWLDNLRATPSFTAFFNALEAKLQQTREE